MLISPFCLVLQGKVGRGFAGAGTGRLLWSTSTYLLSWRDREIKKWTDLVYFFRLYWVIVLRNNQILDFSFFLEDRIFFTLLFFLSNCVLCIRVM